MFAKIISVAAFVAAVAAQADRYPAGVSPQQCPNYPLCNNQILTPYNSAPQHNQVPQYQHQPQHTPDTYNYQAYSAPAAQYPAGVSAASCPNYPFCSSTPLAQSVPPLPGFSARLYPDGVNPSVCPRYPFCN